MSLIDRALLSMNNDEKETYVSFLREVVGGPGVGGYGQHLGSLAPLVFATEAQKAEALRRTSEYQLEIEGS
jgi:hypothetical protein